VTPTVQISTAPVAAGLSAANTGSLNGYTSVGLGNRVPFQRWKLDVAKAEKIDVRLTKNIPIKERYKAMFTFDASTFQSPLLQSVQPGVHRNHQQRHRHSKSGCRFRAGRRLQDFRTAPTPALAVGPAASSGS